MPGLPTPETTETVETEVLTPQAAAAAVYEDMSIYSFADRKKILSHLNRLQREAIEAETKRLQAEAQTAVQLLQDLID